MSKFSEPAPRRLRDYRVARTFSITMRNSPAAAARTHGSPEERFCP
ncbi:MAG TPA: hypothetical protein VGB73_17205 [Pyrinomonadaceae bacterium]